ncbi:hypothetical protein MMC16_000296 [Acarospora aff. strigata]|nr:hypothetical protein [Acarospora aff. strigata]
MAEKKFSKQMGPPELGPAAVQHERGSAHAQYQTPSPSAGHDYRTRSFSTSFSYFHVETSRESDLHVATGQFSAHLPDRSRLLQSKDEGHGFWEDDSKTYQEHYSFQYVRHFDRCPTEPILQQYRRMFSDQHGLLSRQEDVAVIKEGLDLMQDIRKVVVTDGFGNRFGYAYFRD